MCNNGQVVSRIQTELRTLQETNNRLLAANKEAMEHLQNCDQMAKALASENAASRRIIWAMAHQSGGEISIPDEVMRRAADDVNQITSRHEPEQQATIIGAKVAEKGGDDAPV